MLKKSVILGGLGLTMGFGGSDQQSFRSAGLLGECYDTRDREAYGWVHKGTTNSIEDARSKCQGYEYISIECPTEAGFDVFCVPTKPPSSAIIGYDNCNGDPSSALQLNYGSNGHCTGPYLEFPYALGGWHRGKLYDMKDFCWTRLCENCDYQTYFSETYKTYEFLISTGGTLAACKESCAQVNRVGFLNCVAIDFGKGERANECYLNFAPHNHIPGDGSYTSHNMFDAYTYQCDGWGRPRDSAV